jgi:8-oxo-dGTP pyrophosphatase MutT (NUDIX family)
MDKRNFHVTIKGLYFDDHGRVLLMREHDGVWDLPGGRLEHGEDFSTALKRECREEMGIECGILDTTPYWAWSALDRDGLWKVVLCFRITLPHLEFIPSDECVAVGFYDDTGLATIPVAPQLQALAGLLAKNPRHL